MPIPPRFPITPDDIDRVVASFYARIRAHATLGPIFAAHVSDWPTHEAKIAAFWRNAILFERSYDGNPVQVHQQAGNVRPGHFSVWLGLFDEVLRAELTPEAAAGFSALAHRIGASLRYAVTEGAQPSNAPPNLRSNLF